jgi:FkbM family methyltransferase
MGNSVTEINYNNNKLLLTSLSETDHIFKHLKITGNFYELKLLEKVKSLNLKGTYVDVGSNIGNHTIFFSKFCNSDKVVSIEMNYMIFNVLEENIKNLNTDNVITINAAVGERPKKVVVSDIDMTNIGMTKIVGDGGDVVVNSLDILLNDFEDINLIKIDVEGYESNVLEGAKKIILKYNPIIIAELRNDEEFNNFERIANELGYSTDKVNYASTPTYFWYKKEVKYDFVYIIPTYERYEKIKNLIENILESHTNTLIIIINDGSKDDRYLDLKNLNKNIIYLENTNNNGKEKYWVTVNKLLDEMSKYKFKYGVMLADDFKLINGYFEKLKTIINENEIVRLFTQKGIGETNWGYLNWVDGAFCAPHSFFKKINFELHPINSTGKMNSSGVGCQMTRRLNNLNYKVKNYGSLVEHTGNDDSKMHPIFRKTQPLISNFDINEKILTIIIPTYKNTSYLQECLDSVLLSVKNLDCEIIVGIDGCKETLNYIKTKKFDNRIRFYFFEKNVGPYIIKNSLCSISNSEIILFFDSDDIMNENMVADMLELHKTKDIVKPKYYDFIDNVNNHKKITYYGEGVFSIKKEVFMSMNGFEPWRCEADSNFSNRVYKNGLSLGFTKNNCFFRRLHSNSLTQSPETGYDSKIRKDYRILSFKNNGELKLPSLVTEIFTEIKVEIIVNDKISKDIEIIHSKSDLIKKSIKESLNKRKEINYNKVNSIINTEPVKQDVRIVSEKKPIDREKLIEIKKDSIRKTIEKVIPSRPNRRNNLPNIFSGKKNL